MCDIEWFEAVVMGGCPIFTNSQRLAAAFLERHGQRFLIEFGVDNCEAKAEALAKRLGCSMQVQ